MKYYTIHDNKVLTSESKEVLEEFYNEALIAPDDYEEGKYIAKNGKLVLVKGFDEAKAKRRRKDEILVRLNILDNKSIRALRAGELEQLQEYENEAIELRQELKLLGV